LLWNIRKEKRKTKKMQRYAHELVLTNLRSQARDEADIRANAGRIGLKTGKIDSSVDADGRDSIVMPTSRESWHNMCLARAVSNEKPVEAGSFPRLPGTVKTETRRYASRPGEAGR
jgi:hypothetical protein